MLAVGIEGYPWPGSEVECPRIEAKAEVSRTSRTPTIYEVPMMARTSSVLYEYASIDVRMFVKIKTARDVTMFCSDALQQQRQHPTMIRSHRTVPGVATGYRSEADRRKHKVGTRIAVFEY